MPWGEWRFSDVGSSFDDGAIDRLLGDLITARDERRRLVIDATRTLWVDPAGLVSLFVVGAWVREAGLPRPHLLVPENRDARAYWSRMGVARHAGEYFDVHGDLPSSEARPDSPLITLTRLTPDVDGSVGEDPLGDLLDRVIGLLRSQLGLGAARAMATAMELVDVAAEMMEDSGTAVWYAAQAYSWRARLGRRVVVLALGCHGYEPRVALEERHAGRYGPRWNDATALEAALLHGVTRFADSRPRGFSGLRRAVSRLDGKLTVRSGTARISLVPDWDDGEPLVTGLPEQPGTVVWVVVTEGGVGVGQVGG